MSIYASAAAHFAHDKKKNLEKLTSSPSFFSPMGSIHTNLDEEVMNFSLDTVNSDVPPRTKIIATIGPKTKSPEAITRLLEAGISIARLNFSHGDHAYHGEVITNLRRVMNSTKKLIAILLDTKGPEIRSGKMKNGGEVQLEKGQKFTLTTDTSVLGDNTITSISHANFPLIIKPGDNVLFADGLVSMTVQSTDPQNGLVQCIVNNTALLGETKSVNLPGVISDLPAVTEKDIADIQFGVQAGVDFIAASFTRKASDILTIRELLGAKANDIRIIAKIESQEGLDNFDEILKVADGIMVARGDLGVEIPIEEVCLAQKMMIRKCNLAGKVVITATQMLESMIKNPSPTRAEATDVANAVYDGTDCVMLSGETAKGEYPELAVKMMADICREAEASTDYSMNYNAFRSHFRGTLSVGEAISSSAVKVSLDLKAALLIVLTESGTTARFVAKYRPRCPILCITDKDSTARQALASRGVLPLLMGSMSGSDSLIARAIAVAKKLGMCQVGDLVICTSGAKEGVSGSTNVVKVLTVQY